MDDHTNSTTLTIAQIEALLRDDTARLASAEVALNDILTNVDNIERGPDSDSVKAAMLSDLTPELTQREADAESTAAVVLANVDHILTQTEPSVMTLSAQEHAVANTRRDDIRDSVNEDPLGDLVTQVRFALTNDDRPGMYLYAKFLPRRLSDTDPAWADTGTDDDRQDLRRMLLEIRDRLSDTTLKPIHDKAVALRSRASKLEWTAQARKRSSQTYGFQSAREVRW